MINSLLILFIACTIYVYSAQLFFNTQTRANNIRVVNRKEDYVVVSDHDYEAIIRINRWANLSDQNKKRIVEFFDGATENQIEVDYDLLLEFNQKLGDCYLITNDIYHKRSFKVKYTQNDNIINIYKCGKVKYI